VKKVLVITGGSSGIGAAIASLAANEKYSICINYRNSTDKAETLSTELSDLGANVISVKADISTENGVLDLFEEVDSTLGTVTHLVNNAGIISPIQPFEEYSYSRLQEIFGINVIGSFLCAREAVKRMSTKLGGIGGVIVNISSVAASLGSPNEFIDYAASKGAIDTLTVGLSKEVAEYGIRVNGVRPGLIDTEIHAHAGDPQRVERFRNSIPMKRAGSAEEVAKAVVWLLSDNSSYVTGSIVNVSGGR
jgi:NAD(P)-dependent dehydrogenase (short-subunit alcohol dehydrogenase family)